MAPESKLLKMPLELRQQVYSHLFIHDSVVDVASTVVEKPLQNGVVRSCRQIYHEALDYYYANNTFLLSLFRPLEAKSKLLQHLGRGRNLQVELGDLGFSPTERGFFLHLHTEQGCDWFIKTLRQARQDQQGGLLKTLVVIDRCGTSIVSESILPTSQIWKDQKWREMKRREVLAKALRPLCHDVDNIIIESRAMSEERNKRGRLTKNWSVVLSACQVRPLA